MRAPGLVNKWSGGTCKTKKSADRCSVSQRATGPHVLLGTSAYRFLHERKCGSRNGNNYADSDEIGVRQPGNCVGQKHHDWPVPKIDAVRPPSQPLEGRETENDL